MTATQEGVARQIAAQVPRGPKAVLGQVASDYRLLRATKYGAGPLVVLFIVDLVQQIDSIVPRLLLPEIRRDFDVSLTQIGLFTQLFGVVGLLTVPLIGFLSDRVRRTVLVGVANILSGIFSACGAASPNIFLYQATRAFDASGESLGNVPTSSLLFDYYPIEARAKVASLRAFAFTLAGMGSPVLVAVAAERWGWRQVMLTISPLVVLSGVWALGRLPEPVRGYWERLRAGEDERTAVTEQTALGFGEALRTFMKIRTIRRILFLSPLLSVARGGYGVLYALYLVEQFDLSPTERSLLGVPTALVGLVALLMGGAVADILIRHNPGRVLLMGGLVSVGAAVANVFVVIVPSLWLAIGFGILFSVIDRFLDPAQAAVSSLVVPARLRGQGLSVFVVAALPALPFATLPYYVAERYGIRMGLLLYAPFYIVAAAVSASAARFFSFDQRSAIAAANATNEYNRAKEEGLVRMLLCRDVDVAYDGVQVLFGVDLTVDQGETLALLGTNGAGKSTLLRAISGTQEASGGAIFFDGREITHMPPHEIARLGIVHMPGGRSTFPTLTVQENLDLALLELDEPKADLTARMEEVFGFFPVLRERLHQQAGSLSGGEQQMVGLAQAFLWKPRVLMIDELSLGLAPSVVGQLLDIVRAINALGATVILVEQSVNVALTVAERAVFMEKGEVRFDGPTADLLRRPDIMRAIYVKGSAALDDGRRTARREVVSADRSRAILEVRGATLSYGGVRALDDVSLTLHEGEALGLIGPNGAGKTTLFDVISGLVPPDRGSVWFDGLDITRLRPDERGARGLVRRFQDARLFASLTVHEAVCVALDRQLPVRSTFLTALQIGAVRRGEARVRARADALLDLLDLGAYRTTFVSDLSTGLRRVVDLACVLAAEPRVVLLDEPSSGIAQAEAEGLAPLLRRVRYETGCSLLLIEHDMSLISKVSDELVAMVQGKVVVQGLPSDVLEHPLVVEAYLGHDESAIGRSGVR